MTIAAFYKALVQQVAKSVKGHNLIVPVMASDLSEPVVRPSIKITLDDIRAEQATTHQNMRHVTVWIYYYPEERKHWRGAHWSMLDALTDALIDGVTVDQFVIYPDDALVYDNLDGVLVVTQSFFWHEERETHDTSEIMDSLEVNLQ